jgi:hypothetical protein
VIDTQAVVNPVSRIVLIGNGESGRMNDADVAKILLVMQNSPVNLHLYILDQALQAQVAKIIPQYPALAAMAELVH